MHFTEKNKKRNQVYHIIKTYGRKSIFFHYVLSSLIPILLIFILFCFIVPNYYDYILTQELTKQVTVNSLQSKDIFDNLTEDFYNDYELACNSDTVREFLHKDATSLFQQNISLDVQNFIHERLENSSLTEEIYLYSFKNEYSISSSETMKLGNENKYEWYRTYRSTKLPFIMFPRKDGNTRFTSIYVCNEIYENNELIGLMCSKINFEKFGQIIKESFVSWPDKIFVVSDIGLILYSDDSSLVNTLMFERDDLYTAFRSAKNVEGNSILYDDYVIAVAKSAKSQLMIMSYLKLDSLRENYKFIDRLILIGALVIFPLSILLALYFAYRHYSSVAYVMQILDKPEMLNQSSGLLSEFFYIANSISDISQKNQNISSELSEKMYLLKTAQIAALQAQINPHFLFNTLQLINLSILKETRKDTLATSLISQLSSLVRIAYDTENYIVSVEEEIETTRTYLNIQQARYLSQLNVSINVSPDCNSVKTIKLLLQPLVENSIVHGLKGQQPPWFISIYCYRDGEYLVYEICDNGSGIDDQTMQNLTNILSQDKIDRHEKVGISNVNQRLKLVFGRKCSIKITSIKEAEKQCGTKIIIRHIINEHLES